MNSGVSELDGWYVNCGEVAGSVAEGEELDGWYVNFGELAGEDGVSG